MNHRKILIVDDEAQSLRLLQGLLLSLGWDVVTASNGREALETVQSTDPRVIVLDMVMPQIDGFQVARFLKRHPDYRHIPILAATSLSSRTDRERCFAAGCDDYLAKPFTAEQLDQRLDALLAMAPSGI